MNLTSTFHCSNYLHSLHRSSMQSQFCGERKSNLLQLVGSLLFVFIEIASDRKVPLWHSWTQHGWRSLGKMLSSHNAARGGHEWMCLAGELEWALNIRLAATSGKQTIVRRPLMMIDAGGGGHRPQKIPRFRFLQETHFRGTLIWMHLGFQEPRRLKSFCVAMPDIRQAVLC